MGFLIGFAVFAILCIIGGVKNELEKQKAARATIEINERQKAAQADKEAK